jgi:hypothetical protein
MNTDRPEPASPGDDAAPTGADRSRRRRARLATTTLVNTAPATTALIAAIGVKYPQFQGD